jgi:sterol desaturase/sphingolipid hydroxylase (fatty acid hydroxylase superfamily)
MYEARGTEPISTRAFALRVARHLLFSLGLLAGSLAIGMAGYMGFEALAWRDAFLNSAMLLGGMGPVDKPATDGGKVFAGIYALYAGLLFIFVLALLLAPVAHRILHRFHWEQDRGD